MKLKNGKNKEIILVNVSDETHKFELANAKLEELEKLKSNHVFEVVNNEDPYCISLKWVNTTKFVSGKLKVTSRLVAKGFQEKLDLPQTDSPTFTKEGLCVAMNVIVTNKYNGYVTLLRLRLSSCKVFLLTRSPL